MSHQHHHSDKKVNLQLKYLENISNIKQFCQIYYQFQEFQYLHEKEQRPIEYLEKYVFHGIFEDNLRET